MLSTASGTCQVRHAVTDPELIAVLGRLAAATADMRDPAAAAVSARDGTLFTVTRADCCGEPRPGRCWSAASC